MHGSRWGDLDFDAGQLAVAHTITTAGFDHVVAGPPKTPRSRRQVFLDDATFSILGEHRMRLREEHRPATTWDGDNDLVFRDELGGSVHPDWSSYGFGHLIRQVGAKRIRLTISAIGMRRWPLEGGHTSEDRLGSSRHATVAVTLDPYSNVTPSIAGGAADVASRVLE